MVGLVKNKEASAKPPWAKHFGLRWTNRSGRSKSRGEDPFSHQSFLRSPGSALPRLSLCFISPEYFKKKVKRRAGIKPGGESGRARTTKRPVQSVKHTSGILTTVCASNRLALSNGSALISTPGWRKATLFRQGERELHTQFSPISGVLVPHTFQLFGR
jgi:hypothetical protein